MSKTYKDKPGYLNGIRKKKEKLSQEYLRHRNGEDDDWEALYQDRLSNDSKHYRCIERKMPIFYDDFDVIEGLVDQLDDLTDKDPNAA